MPDVIKRRQEDVRTRIDGAPGFVSYTAFRSGNGELTVTVGEDPAGPRSPPGAPPSSSSRTSKRQATRR